MAKQTNTVTVEKGDGGAGLAALFGFLSFAAFILGVFALFLAFLAFALSLIAISCCALLARSMVLQHGAKAAVLWEYRQTTPSTYGPQGPMWPGEPDKAALSYLARTRRREDSIVRQALQQVLIGRAEPQGPEA